MPTWFSLTYPTLSELLVFAASLGCMVGETRLSVPVVICEPGQEAILIPKNGSPLVNFWALAFGLGCIVMHDQGAAKEWASRALIPVSRIPHGHASEMELIGAISRHYETISQKDSEVFKLASKIAEARLWALKGEFQFLRTDEGSWNVQPGF